MLSRKALVISDEDVLISQPTQGERLRVEFEKNKGIADINQVERILARGEAKLREYAHPDPYIVPYYPGGSLYARNPPVQPEYTHTLDFTREELPATHNTAS
ncbi:hypothetical protein ABBQ32_010299 [Trebouxia sp. C0010 RCD-2024]